jgi:hypothetical protein
MGDLLSARIPVSGERLPVHDRGKVVTQAMLMLAGGGESCADIEHLRAQQALFGSVASDSTLYRTFRQIDRDTLVGLWDAMAEVRTGVCAGRQPRSGPRRWCRTSTRRCMRVAVLDQAIAQLPQRIAVGHRPGDDSSQV